MKGFGPSGLGIVTVSGVPDISKLRRRLLMLIDRFAVNVTPLLHDGQATATPKLLRSSMAIDKLNFELGAEQLSAEVLL